MIIRLLEPNDFHKNFLEILNCFGKPKSDLKADNFKKLYHEVVSKNTTVCVAEEDGRILGCGTVIIENKFHNGGCKCAHIEDIAVLPSERKKNIGSSILNFLKKIAIKNNCFKITLATSSDNISFYKKNGFIERGLTFELFLS